MIVSGPAVCFTYCPSCKPCYFIWFVCCCFFLSFLELFILLMILPCKHEHSSWRLYWAKFLKCFLYSHEYYINLLTKSISKPKRCGGSSRETLPSEARRFPDFGASCRGQSNKVFFYNRASCLQYLVITHAQVIKHKCVPI